MVMIRVPIAESSLSLPMHKTMIPPLLREVAKKIAAPNTAVHGAVDEPLLEQFESVVGVGVSVA